MCELKGRSSTPLLLIMHIFFHRKKDTRRYSVQTPTCESKDDDVDMLIRSPKTGEHAKHKKEQIRPLFS